MVSGNEHCADDSDTIVLHRREYDTLRVLVTNIIAELRSGRPVAAYDEAREIENMVEQWGFDSQQEETDG